MFVVFAWKQCSLLFNLQNFYSGPGWFMSPKIQTLAVYFVLANAKAPRDMYTKDACRPGDTPILDMPLGTSGNAQPVAFSTAWGD